MNGDNNDEVDDGDDDDIDDDPHNSDTLISRTLLSSASSLMSLSGHFSNKILHFESLKTNAKFRKLRPDSISGYQNTPIYPL